MRPELAELQLAAVMRMTSEAVLLFDEHGALVGASPAAGLLLGSAPDQPLSLASVTVKRATGEQLADAELPWARAVAGQEVPSCSLLLARAQGEVWVRASALPLIDGSGAARGAVATLQEERARLLLGRTGEEVLHRLAHDLRSPLAAIIGHAQVTQRFSDQTDLVRKSAEMIIASARRMNGQLSCLTEDPQGKRDGSPEPPDKG